MSVGKYQDKWGKRSKNLFACYHRKHTSSAVVCKEWYWKGTGWLMTIRFEILTVTMLRIEALCWCVSDCWCLVILQCLHLQVSARSVFFLDVSHITTRVGHSLKKYTSKMLSTVTQSLHLLHEVPRRLLKGQLWLGGKCYCYGDTNSVWKVSDRTVYKWRAIIPIQCHNKNN